jgi:hypothetical protein
MAGDRPMTDDDHAAIRDLLARLTDAWRGRRYDEIGPLLDERVVFVTPSFIARSEGRDACIYSYRQFVEAATIHHYAESNHSIDVWGDTAVASYRFDIEWQMNGPRTRQWGFDVFTLVRRDGAWRIAWRLLVEPSPTRSA